MTGPGKGWRRGQTSPLTAAEEATIAAALRAGNSVRRVAEEMHRHQNAVLEVRDRLGIPPSRGGSPVLAPVTDERPAPQPHIIAPGLWCIERPNQAQWRALVDAASEVELIALRMAMTWVLDLPLNATDLQIEEALIAEHRTAEDLAGLYIKARGYGR